MKNQDIVLLGLSAVAVGLALKASGVKFPSMLAVPVAGTGTFRRYNPFYSQPGQAIDPQNPGQFIPVNDLVNGTVSDFYTGGNSSYDSPTIRAIESDVLRTTYGATSPTSVVKNSQGYW